MPLVESVEVVGLGGQVEAELGRVLVLHLLHLLHLVNIVHVLLLRLDLLLLGEHHHGLVGRGNG